MAGVAVVGTIGLIVVAAVWIVDVFFSVAIVDPEQQKDMWKSPAAWLMVVLVLVLLLGVLDRIGTRLFEVFDWKLPSQ